ncbi:MAG: hypothetical protein ACRC2T_04770 [Thermoguttaceae bacterium]
MKPKYFTLLFVIVAVFSCFGFSQTGSNSGASKTAKPAVKPVDPFKKPEKVETEKRPNMFEDALTKEVVIEKRKPKQPPKTADQASEKRAVEDEDYDPFADDNGDDTSFSSFSSPDSFSQSEFGDNEKSESFKPRWGRNSDPFDSFVAGVIASMFVKH